MRVQRCRRTAIYSSRGAACAELNKAITEMNVLPESLPLPTAPQRTACAVVYHAFWDGALSDKHLASVESCMRANVAGRADAEVWLWLSTATYRAATAAPQSARVSALVTSGLVLKECCWASVSADVPRLQDVPERSLRAAGLQHLADAVRLALLYKFGGVWFDLDVLWLRSLDAVLAAHGSDVCAYRWEAQAYPNNAVLISLAPRDARLLRLIEFLCDRGRGFGFQTAALTFDCAVPLTVLPCAWFDRGWIEDGFFLRDFFSAPRAPPGLNAEARAAACRALLQFYAGGSVCFHWHNKWSAVVHPDSTFSLLCAALGVLQ